MNYLVFDTETNGFPPKARMTQLAFCLFNDKGEILEEYQAFIKPDGWVIPKEKFFIENGMTTERNEALGIPVFEALRKFQEALKAADYKIAHNIQFDRQIVQNEIIMAKIEPALFQYKKECCTMTSSVSFVGALNKWGKPGKWPNLQELHKKCFGEEFDGAHDALADVKATVRCFLDLKQRGLLPAIK